MFITCNHPYHMSVMVQIRHVPEGLHRRLKARAALAGVSLSDYLRAEMEKSAQLPTMEEMAERLRRLSPVRTKTHPANLVREIRQER
jgi:plasmid stability protein